MAPAGGSLWRAEQFQPRGLRQTLAGRKFARSAHIFPAVVIRHAALVVPRPTPAIPRVPVLARWHRAAETLEVVVGVGSDSVDADDVGAGQHAGGVAAMLVSVVHGVRASAIGIPPKDAPACLGPGGVAIPPGGALPGSHIPQGSLGLFPLRRAAITRSAMAHRRLDNSRGYRAGRHAAGKGGTRARSREGTCGGRARPVVGGATGTCLMRATG